MHHSSEKRPTGLQNKTTVFSTLLTLTLTGVCFALILLSYKTMQNVMELTLHNTSFFARESANLFREQGANIMLEQIEIKTRQQAHSIQAKLDNAQLTARTLSNAIQQVAASNIPPVPKKNYITRLLQQTMYDIPNASVVFTQWETNAPGLAGLESIAVSGNGQPRSQAQSASRHNQSSIFWARRHGKTIQRTDRLPLPYSHPLHVGSTSSSDEKETRLPNYYEQVKTLQKPLIAIMPPASALQTTHKTPPHWHIAALAPVIVNNTFLGVTGVGFTSASISAKLGKLNRRDFDGVARASIITEEGILIASSDNAILPGTLIPLRNESWTSHLTAIVNREFFNRTEGDSLETSAPVFPASTHNAASLHIVQPNAIVYSPSRLIDQTINSELRFIEKSLQDRAREQLVQQATVGSFLLLLTIIAVILLRRIGIQQAMLRNSERNMRSILQNTSAIIFVKDLARRYTKVNLSFEQLVSLNESEIIGKTDYDFFPKELADRFYENDTETIVQNKAMQWEEDATGVDGLHSYITTKFPLHDSKGDITHICGIAVDITERRMAEKQKENLELHLNNLIDSIPSILVGVNADAIITQWNRSAATLFDTPKEQAIGKPLDTVLPHFKDQLHRIQETIHTLQPQIPQQKKFMCKDEQVITTVSIYPLRSEQRSEAVLRIEDITRQTRIEEVMIQTEKMLSVGGLAAGMAHEINNPLGAILQGAQNIERRLSPQIKGNIIAAEEVGCDLQAITGYLESRKILTMIKGIREAGERAARIVQNMLNFSRKSESVRESHDLTALVDKAIELARSDYDLKKNYDIKQVAFVKAYPAHPARAFCIHTEIEQVLLNLFKNAAQAMAENQTISPTITVSIQSEFSNISINVSDNGPGMDEATRKRIFEPFFTTKSPGSGTGLGLSVSYFIITQNHGGTFAVTSELGEGTTFHIRLPIEGFTPSSGV